jgi:hypothetical protein
MDDNKMYQKETGELYCETCDYISTHRGNYLKHLTTRKHKEGNNEVKQDNNVSTDEDIKEFGCEYCTKTYKFRSGLSRHKKKCNNKQLVEKDTFTKGDLLQIMKMIAPVVSHTTNNNQKTYNNNNKITNQINIQLFLDDKCKDAMTIQKFALQLTLTIEDLIKKRTLGLCGGVDNIVIKNLAPIPLLERPIHCTDVKKRQWMINDEASGWKEDNGDLLMKQAGFGINKKFNTIWETAYPGWKESEALKKQWLQLVKDLNADQSEKEIGRALKKIGPECKLSVQDIKSVL